MALINKSFSDLNNDSVARLVALGYTDAQFKGTAVRNIVESCNIQLADLYTAMNNNLTTQYITQAAGDSLDGLALLVGVVRRAGESTQNLRVRTSQAIQTKSGTNLSALTQSLLSLANVRDVIVRPYTHGIGSLSFYLIGVQGIVDAGTITLAQTTLDNQGPAGCFNLVTVPTSLFVNITGVISTSADNSVDLRTTAQTAISSYLANLSMGQQMVRAALDQAGLNAGNGKIIDFNPISISTTDTLGNTTEQLIGDYTPFFDQELQPGTILISS
jgi:hypothetical protein